MDGALPSVFGGAFSVAVEVVRRVAVVVVVGGLLEKIPDKGLPDAVVIADVAELFALVRAAADAEVAAVAVLDRVKGLICGSRLGDVVTASFLAEATSFWTN